MDEDDASAQGAFIESFPVTTPGHGVVPPWLADPEELAWSLRAAGADEDQVAEAQERLEEGPAALELWLQDQRCFDPPVCLVCGLALVDPEWRGSATLTCNRCGATWRATVDSPDNHSLSGVGGVSAEWLQQHPENGTFTVEAIDVITGAVPPVPDKIEPDVYFPVARWRSEQSAAVLFLRQIPDELVDVDGGRWEELVVFLERTDDSWVEVYSEASAGFLDPLNPAEGFFERYGAWLGKLHCDSDDSDPDAVWVLGGRAGPQVARIEAVTDQRVDSFEPQAPHQFFLAALTGTGSFRFVDTEGAVITVHAGRLELPTTE